MSTEAKQLLSKAGLRTSEFWSLVLAMAATIGGTLAGVESSVLISMWGAVTAYGGGRAWGKTAKAKALAAIGGSQLGDATRGQQ